MSTQRFRAFAWFFVAYLVAVILFGAWVRITGSGNGCGSHWPACNGEVIPRAAAAKTVIEYTHRLMSGLCGIFALVLVVWARRVSPRVFRAALITLGFLIVESLLGALLVKRHLVVDNVSVERAFVVALHLANTMMLTASAALVAWRAAHDSGGQTREGFASGSRLVLGVALAALLLTSMAGAVTALGDTVFPTQPALDGTLLAKIRSDASPEQHFLVRLRILHPAIAILAAVLAGAALVRSLDRRGRDGAPAATAALIALGSLALQSAIGFFNVLLAAPGWLQIVHLLMAQVVWIATWVAFLGAGQPGRELVGVAAYRRPPDGSRTASAVSER